MQAECSHCGKKHLLNDADVEKHGKVQFRCTKCGQSTVVENKKRPEMTMVISPLPSFARSEGGGTSQSLAQDEGLRLPANVKIVLAILSGPDQGTAHTLTKPRVVIGRRGADIPVNDPEISRQHCMIEVRDKNVNLKDLDSTNGTFYDEERTRAAVLLDGAEFRIGSSLIRVSFLPK
ncbi:MAG TPA: FHA domain-containing protein [Candidatus Acidoferrum sp.]|nr:FHA domain-containing protein [Candidatus Acidoferrum sp.]